MAQQPVEPVGLQLDGADGRGEPRSLRPRLGATRQAGIRHSLDADRTQGRARSTSRWFSANRSGSSSISRKKASTAGPPLLIVAPMSGHYATLLRGTVERLLPGHDVYITDWRDAKLVPRFGRHFRSRRLCRLSDRVPRADRRARGRTAAFARSLPAGGSSVRSDGFDGRRQESVAAQNADDDGRTDRHAQSADGGQHARHPAAA